MSTFTKQLIHYSPEQLSQELQKILNEFLINSSGENITRIIGKELIKQSREITNQIQTRLNQEFSIVIAGDFKRGKSTLINALLQKNLMPTDVTQETVTINEIQYGSELKINAYLQDGGYFPLRQEELKSEKILPILAQYQNQISHLKILTPVEWLQELRIVDTPGTGDILQKFDKQVQAYFHQADAVVWVISPFSPLSKSEQKFLRLAIVPQDFPKLFFVVNMLDMACDESELKKLLNMAQKKIKSIFPHARVFGVSALDELCQIQSLSRPNPALAPILSSYFQEFKSELQSSISLNKSVIKLERASARMSDLLTNLESSLVLLCEAIQAEQVALNNAIYQCDNKTSKLHHKIEQYNQEMRDDILKLCKQTRLWITEFLLRLSTEVINNIKKFDIDEIRCNFPFFLTEKIRQSIQECVNYHQPAIIQSANQTQISIFIDFFQSTDIKAYNLDILVPSFGFDDAFLQNINVVINVVQMAIELSPIGEFFRVINSFFIKNNSNSKKNHMSMNYQLQLQKYLPNLQDTLLQQIDEIYANIYNDIKSQIEHFFQQKIEASLSVMKQAQNIRISGEENLNATRENIELALSFIADTRNEIKLLRQKLER